MNRSDKKRLNTVDAVIEDMIAGLTLEEKVAAANLDESELCVVELALGKYIRHRLDQLDEGVDDELMKDCLDKSGESLDEVDAASVILRELWRRLRATH